MRLIVGLGNPGSEYAQTRHNAGFRAVEQFASRRHATWKHPSRFQSRLARLEFEGVPLILCQPQSFMNRSGEAVQAIVAYHRIPVSQVLVVVDDADLPLGGIRMRPGGSSGGHRGLDSIEQHLGTREYPRVRIGIGRRSEGVREITDYVLGRFSSTEMPLLDKVLERVCDQLECWLRAGIGKAMSEFNGVINTAVVNES